jgi:hypothetical protein
MADDSALTPERLSELLARLDEVMADAASLRRQITRQLNERERLERPKVVVNRRRPKQR